MENRAVQPRVSVIIPAYNAAHCIGRSVGSVLAQTEQNFEIVVVDDGSADATVATVEALAATDPRIVLVRAEQNGGPSAARNLGFANARGTWLALLDADDAYRPERLKTLCDLAEEHAFDAIGDDVVFYDDCAAREVGVAHFVRKSGLNILSLTDYLETSTYRVGLAQALYREDRPVSLIKLVMCAAYVRTHAIAYSLKYRYCEDFLFYFDLLRAGGKVALLDRPMYLYTEPLGTISRAASPHTRTVADRRSVVDAVDEILEGNGSLAARQRRLLHIRKRSTETAIRYDAFRRETAEFGKGKLIARVLARPSLWFRFGRELRHGFLSRVRQRSALRGS